LQLQVISEDDYWLTADNRKIRFRDLDDHHLLNIISWVKAHPAVYSPELIPVLQTIAAKRGPAFTFAAVTHETSERPE
jgi:hypothetical protein